MSAIPLADAGETEALGREIAAILRPGDVVTLAGPLGSGKTTLARGMLAGLGLAGEAPSPSFAIVIAYEPPDVRLPAWHVDLYRLSQATELAELGLDDTGDAVLLVEWPERAAGALGQDILALVFKAADRDSRCLTWTAGPSFRDRWPPARFR